MERLFARDLDTEGYREVARVLRSGGVVCMPTDTVYGLAVDARRDEAVGRLFRLKGRPSTRPVILLVDSVAMARSLSEPPACFGPLAGRFWPGPVTFVLPALPDCSRLLTADTGKIGLRWPASALAVAIIRELGAPITSTSANLSGRPVVRSGDEAAATLSGVDLLVDAGRLPERPASTLVDLTGDAPSLLREGPVPFDDIVRCLSDHLQGLPT